MYRTQLAQQAPTPQLAPRSAGERATKPLRHRNHQPKNQKTEPKPGSVDARPMPANAPTHEFRCDPNACAVLAAVVEEERLAQRLTASSQEREPMELTSATRS